VGVSQEKFSTYGAEVIVNRRAEQKKQKIYFIYTKVVVDQMP